MKKSIPPELIESRIFLIRKQKVMVDKDLAILYNIETRALVQAVKRNLDRFPADFMFQLNKKEFNLLKSHFVISKRGGTRRMPYAFTEQGVAMLSSVIKSKRAVLVNIEIMRTFVKLRNLILDNKDLWKKLNLIEKKSIKHDLQIKTIFESLKDLMFPQKEIKQKIGFKIN